MADELKVNGVALGPAPEAEKSVTLPSGRVGAIRRGRGRDLMRAQRVAAERESAAADGAAIVMALIAEVARIDGAPIVYEDVLEMDVADVLALQAEVLGENFQFPPPPTLRHSSTSDSRPAS
jgi:hypothetical protein